MFRISASECSEGRLGDLLRQLKLWTPPYRGIHRVYRIFYRKKLGSKYKFRFHPRKLITGTKVTLLNYANFYFGYFEYYSWRWELLMIVSYHRRDTPGIEYPDVFGETVERLNELWKGGGSWQIFRISSIYQTATIPKTEVSRQVDNVGRGSRFNGKRRRGRRRRPLVAGRYTSDVFRCWRKTCKTASRRVTGDLLATVINGPTSTSMSPVSLKGNWLLIPLVCASDSHIPPFICLFES